MLGLLCLGQLPLEMRELLLSRRQVSALLGELVLQLGWHVFNHLQITAACLAMQFFIKSHAAAGDLQWIEYGLPLMP